MGGAPARAALKAERGAGSAAAVPRSGAALLLSDAGVPIEQISLLVGHSGTTTTETIYRKQIRPVLVHGADVMDQIFIAERSDA